MSSTTEHAEQSPADDFVPTEELARRQGVKPIKSVDELAQLDLWEELGWVGSWRGGSG